MTEETEIADDPDQVVSEREVFEDGGQSKSIDEFSLITMISLVTIVLFMIGLSIALMVYNRFKMLKKEAM